MILERRVTWVIRLRYVDDHLLVCIPSIKHSTYIDIVSNQLNGSTSTRSAITTIVIDNKTKIRVLIKFLYFITYNLKKGTTTVAVIPLPMITFLPTAKTCD